MRSPKPDILIHSALVVNHGIAACYYYKLKALDVNGEGKLYFTSEQCKELFGSRQNLHRNLEKAAFVGLLTWKSNNDSLITRKGIDRSGVTCIFLNNAEKVCQSQNLSSTVVFRIKREAVDVGTLETKTTIAALNFLQGQAERVIRTNGKDKKPCTGTEYKDTKHTSKILGQELAVLYTIFQKDLCRNLLDEPKTILTSIGWVPGKGKESSSENEEKSLLGNRALGFNADKGTLILMSGVEVPQVSQVKLAMELGCSVSTIQRRLADLPKIRLAFWSESYQNLCRKAKLMGATPDKLMISFKRQNAEDLYCSLGGTYYVDLEDEDIEIHVVKSRRRGKGQFYVPFKRSKITGEKDTPLAVDIQKNQPKKRQGANRGHSKKDPLITNWVDSEGNQREYHNIKSGKHLNK